MFCLYENLMYFTDLFGELKIILVYRVFQKNGGGVHFRWSKFFPQPIFHCIPFFLNHCYGVTCTICVVRVFLKSLLWFDFCYLCCEIYRVTCYFLRIISLMIHELYGRTSSKKLSFSRRNFSVNVQLEEFTCFLRFGLLTHFWLMFSNLYPLKTTEKLKNFFSKYDQIRSFLWIRSHLPNKSVGFLVFSGAIKWEHWPRTD